MKTKHGFETSIERSQLMRKIKSKNTKAELILRKKLWHLGYRYRLNVASLPGKPDIVLKQKGLVIFVDGEFWHGYNWRKKKPKIKANKDYWIKKIERNMQRDKLNDAALRDLGYSVLHLWEHQIKKDIDACIKDTQAHIL